MMAPSLVRKFVPEMPKTIYLHELHIIAQDGPGNIVVVGQEVG